VPGRDFPLEGPKVTVVDIRNAVAGDTRDGKALQMRRGIEIGHVFKLGTKYSEKLDATFLDENGSAKPCIMGCYGIGVTRMLAAAVEVGHDDNGCVLPVTIAPFELEIVAINADSEQVKTESRRLYDELQARGVDVLLDDRPARPGVKFKDADLLGIPLRIAVGDRGLADGQIELKRRTDDKPTLVPLASAVDAAIEALDDLRAQCRP
jgi:prolyl-tRNA synthetase